MAQARDRFEEGIELFNAGRFFECHEAWEDVWKRADGEARRFYQGLIQLAVATLHTQRGNRRGAASVFEKACRILEGFPDDHMDIDVGRLRRDVAAFIDLQSGMRPPRLMRSHGRRR